MNEEQILAQAEQIARKAQTQGYESLTEEEKRILQMAQQIMQQYDMSSQGGGSPIDEGAGYGAPEAGVPAGGAPEMPVGGNEYANGGEIAKTKSKQLTKGEGSYRKGHQEVNDSISGKKTNKKSYGGNISIDKSELGAPFLKTKDASYYFL